MSSRTGTVRTTSPFPDIAARRMPSHTEETHNGCVTLNALRAGASAEIAGFRDPEHPITRRLFDLGFAPGVPVRLSRKAPMRDPLVVEIAGVELVLRGADASRVFVRENQTSTCNTTGPVS